MLFARPHSNTHDIIFYIYILYLMFLIYFFLIFLFYILYIPILYFFGIKDNSLRSMGDCGVVCRRVLGVKRARDTVAMNLWIVLSLREAFCVEEVLNCKREWNSPMSCGVPLRFESSSFSFAH